MSCKPGEIDRGDKLSGALENLNVPPPINPRQPMDETRRAKSNSSDATVQRRRKGRDSLILVRRKSLDEILGEFLTRCPTGKLDTQSGRTSATDADCDAASVPEADMHDMSLKRRTSIDNICRCLIYI